VTKSGDGVLHVYREHIEVTCLPSDIPDSIVLDVSGLGMNESISIEEIQLPAGVRTLYDENFAVVGVSPMVEQSIESVEEAEGVEGEGEAEGQAAGD
jgi:large subunit ribosomal protein L25